MHVSRGDASRSVLLCLETLLPSNSSRGYYSRAATISLSACAAAATIRGRLLFEEIRYVRFPRLDIVQGVVNTLCKHGSLSAVAKLTLSRLLKLLPYLCTPRGVAVRLNGKGKKIRHSACSMN